MKPKATPAASQLPDLYTLTDAAAFLSISISTAKNRADAYQLGKFSVGGGVRLFTKSDLDRLAEPTGKPGNPNFSAS